MNPFVLIRSAGEMASGIAWRLHMANLRRLCLLDLPDPLCVRRTVSFCPALEEGTATVEGVQAVRVCSPAEMLAAWSAGRIAVMAVADWRGDPPPDVVVDAILAKRNIATALSDAPVVIGLGPGFEAGTDCHFVVETNRGHDLGRVYTSGRAHPNTGIPGEIGGATAARVLRAPAAGLFRSACRIGDVVRRGQAVGEVDGIPVVAQLDGLLRGLIRPGIAVTEGLKLGDVDPRGAGVDCFTISDKARALGGAVLEAIMRRLNAP